MYVIAGATGRVGSAAARELTDAHADVRVVVRRQADAERWVARGAEAAVAALTDRAALGAALRGCSGLFVLLPFDLNADDLDAHADELIASVAGAVADERVPHVVMLSSGGADLAEGTGPIRGLHRMERALLETGTTVTALRSGHFQEKVGDVIDVARETGVYPVFASSADTAHSMAATRDIGAVVADALLHPPIRSEVVDVLGPVYSERTVAGLLGAALGRELHVATVPEEAWPGALMEAGFRPHIAQSLAELYRADEQGLLAPRGDRAVHVSTEIASTIDALLA
ncbi:NAD(P)H-binding protein [Microbacterium lushaniae]|uniref:NAD(P)H-binding protein n=1 Tax=Microbacterium lushaniae TaxID=2614639 RepID=A0A5J6L6P8_9MICO|nr:NAD(P)H-binding protein [Microbacterium lushaniae]QEW04071.1 NAD(P)H-binding protein [Microbacterium lushaniae]